MKLVKKLRALHFFPLSLIAFWNMFSLYATLLPNTECHIFLRELPEFLFPFVYLVWIVIGVYLMYLFLEDVTDHDTFWFTFLWNFILPIAEAVFSLLTVDHLYDFGSTWFAGLGEFLFAVFTIILSVLGGSIFLIGSAISRNRVRKSKEKTHFMIVLGDILNVITAFGLSILLVTLGMTYLYETIDELQRDRELRQKEQFETWVYDTYSEDELSDLEFESYGKVIEVQLLSDGYLEYDDCEYSPEEKEILAKAAENYNELIKSPIDYTQIEVINNFILFDPRAKTISLCYEITGNNSSTNYYEDYWCEVKYNDKLELQEIIFTEERPEDD